MNGRDRGEVPGGGSDPRDRRQSGSCWYCGRCCWTDPQRYNSELLRSVTDISPKELTRNLRELTGISTGLWSEHRVKRAAARYDLTQLGKGLMPTFKSLLI